MPKYNSIQSLITSISKKHGDLYSYDLITEYIPGQLITIICPIHGQFELTAQSHRIGYGCIQCQIQDELIFNNLYKKKTDRFICEAIKKHGNKYDYSKTIVDSTAFVTIICKTHGEFTQRFTDHLAGFNCIECGKISCRSKLNLDIDEFVKRSNEIHKNKYDYSKSIYINQSSRLEIICPKHGSFWQQADHHFYGSNCPKCKSKWKSQDLWLDKLGIPNDQMHRQVRLKNDGITNGRKKFIVDGFDPNSDTIYEYLGDYHHGNPALYDGNEIHCYNKLLLSVIYTNTIKKLTYLYSRGFNIIYVWENQYQNHCLGYIFDPNSDMKLI